MIQPFGYLRRLILAFRNGIGFVPSIYVLGFIVAAIAFRSFEQAGLSEWLSQKSSFWLINSSDTARTVLSTIIGGLISLTVFSFSMIMIVLSQATSTLSPRLLPQLIRDRSHQRVLGIYLGTTIFCFITLIGILPDENWNLPSFTIFICVLLVLICLGMFVYFISSISERIQVGRVIDKVHRFAMNDLKEWQEGPADFAVRNLPYDLEDWSLIKAPESGYIDLVLYRKLSALAGKVGSPIYLCANRGFYVLKEMPLLRTQVKLTEEQEKELLDGIHLSPEGLTENWYQPAMKQITEVAVKAMSPGINDPGTALEAVDLLSELLAETMVTPTHNFIRIKDGGDLYFSRLPFQQFLLAVMQELRQYCKADPMMMLRLAEMLYHLLQRAPGPGHRKALDREIAALNEDAEAHLKNSFDLETYRNTVKTLKSEQERFA